MRLKIIEKDTFVIYIIYNINIINLKIMFPKFLGPICILKKIKQLIHNEFMAISQLCLL